MFNPQLVQNYDFNSGYKFDRVCYGVSNFIDFIENHSLLCLVTKYSDVKLSSIKKIVMSNSRPYLGFIKYNENFFDFCIDKREDIAYVTISITNNVTNRTVQYNSHTNLLNANFELFDKDCIMKVRNNNYRCILDRMLYLVNNKMV